MVETVYKGALEMQHVLSDSKSWKKWLFVLKKVKSSGTASLEYYKESKKDTTKQNPKGVLNLLSNYAVLIVEATALRRFVFEVRTLEQTFRLAAESRELMDEWVYFMQAQTQARNIVSATAKAFDVTPERTEALLRIGARDVCRLYIETTEIVLSLASTGCLLARWPLNCLRRYGCDQGIFSFEAGRKAPLGEGKYSFRSDEDGLLFDTLEHMVKSRASTLPRFSSARPQPDMRNVDATADDNQYDVLRILKGPVAHFDPSNSELESGNAGYARVGTRTLPPPANAFNEYHRLSRDMTASEEYNQIDEKFKGINLDAEYTYAYAGVVRHPAPGHPPPLPPTGPPRRATSSGYEISRYTSSQSSDENKSRELDRNFAPPKDTEL